MVSAVIEPMSGTVDGVNTTFTTNAAYKANSVHIFINGQLKTQGLDDGWTELGGNQVQLAEAPLTGDVIQAWYIPI